MWDNSAGSSAVKAIDIYMQAEFMTASHNFGENDAYTIAR